MARTREQLRNRIFGLTVLVGLIASFAGLYVFQHASALLKAHATVRADFRMISGLRDGSPVQLAGVAVGKVSAIDFVKVEYGCDPRTEDIGRAGEGRTDNCDETLFCSPVGLCADLERMTALRDHTRCIESDDCREDEVCATSEFEHRTPHVLWAGPEGVCVRYNTHHIRVRVEMAVPQETMELIRRDSRAVIASNSVLGDQLVNISPGIGAPLDSGFHVQARRSLYEDIEHWRERLDRVTENIEVSMDAVAEVFAELRDPRWIGAFRGTAENMQTITAAIVRQDGLIGALIGAKSFKRDAGLMLRGIRNATAGLSGIVGNLNNLLNSVSRNVDPVLAETRALSGAMRGMLADLRSTDNNSLVAAIMDNRSAALAADLEVLIAQTEDIAQAMAGIAGSVEHAEGTVGKLLEDPKVAYDLTRLLDRLEDHQGTAALLRWVLQITGTLDIKGAQDPAGGR